MASTSFRGLGLREGDPVLLSSFETLSVAVSGFGNTLSPCLLPDSVRAVGVLDSDDERQNTSVKSLISSVRTASSDLGYRDLVPKQEKMMMLLAHLKSKTLAVYRVENGPHDFILNSEACRVVVPFRQGSTSNLRFGVTDESVLTAVNYLVAVKAPRVTAELDTRV
ncbi:hypothetical protein Tco_0672541, partial [Tanacetum coccineum]